MQRLLLPFRLLADQLRRHGVRGTWRRFVRMVKSAPIERSRSQADRAYDHEIGVDTATWVRVPDLDTASPNRQYAVRYQPTDVDEFALLMAKLDVDHSEFTFVDYGSGKGRVLMLAAEYPFKRIIGVEFSESLDRTARKNLAKLGPDAARVTTHVMDAVDYDPPDEPLVLYFFNPFASPVLRTVLERVNASLDRRPRPAYVVVTAPPELAETIEASSFDPVHVDRLGWKTRGVFRARPRDWSTREEGLTRLRE
jgi:SAM-dependent methyltransferase